MFEERFEMWWDKNEARLINLSIPKEFAKEIWFDGKDEGFKVAFDKGREMGKKEGYKDGFNKGREFDNEG